jgi:proteasome lid subunit RPN8/RPN11
MKIITKQNKTEIKNQIKKIVFGTLNGREKELCGVIVLVKDKIKVRQVKNIVRSSQHEDYIMCPIDLSEQSHDTDLFRDIAENTFIGFWHTHPSWSSLPSQIDIRNCFFNRRYFIYSVPDDSLNSFIVED